MTAVQPINKLLLLTFRSLYMALAINILDGNGLSNKVCMSWTPAKEDKGDAVY